MSSNRGGIRRLDGDDDSSTQRLPAFKKSRPADQQQQQIQQQIQHSSQGSRPRPAARSSPAQSTMNTVVETTVAELIDTALDQTIAAADPGVLSVVIPIVKPIVTSVVNSLIRGLSESVSEAGSNTSLAVGRTQSMTPATSSSNQKSKQPWLQWPKDLFNFFAGKNSETSLVGPPYQTNGPSRKLRSIHSHISDTDFSIVTYNVRPEFETEAERLLCSTLDDGRNFLLSYDYDFRLVNEIVKLDADILCLQTVFAEQFEYLQKRLFVHSYQGNFISRRHRSCGEAVFFKVDRFILQSHSTSYLDDLIEDQATRTGIHLTDAVQLAMSSNHVVQSCDLMCRRTLKELIVLNTRLTPACYRRNDLQALQVCAILKFAGQQPLPFVVTGDFDFTELDPAYQVLRDGYLTSTSNDVFQGQVPLPDPTILVNGYFDGFKHDLQNVLHSAYLTMQNTEALSKWNRPRKEFVQGGYILLDVRKISVCATLDLPARPFVDQGIPNDVLPSASIALKSYLRFI